jgi:hypothetical protein
MVQAEQSRVSQTMPSRDVESRASDRFDARWLASERARTPFPDGPPLMSLFVAAFISFIFLCLIPYFLTPLLLFFSSDEGAAGPLGLPFGFTRFFVLEALIGSIALTVISYAILMARRWRRFPRWLPFLLAFPVAWAMVLPSRLEHGGPWLGWLTLGTVLAGVFCLHWQAFNWARGIWD